MVDVFTALLPLLVVSKCLGVGPFFIDRKKKELKLSRVGLVISVTMLILFSLNAGFFMYTKVVFKDQRIESYISMATDVILLVCGITVTITSMVLTMVQRNKIIRVLGSFYNVSFEITKLSELIPYKSALKYISFYLTMLFLLVVLLLVHSIVYIQRINILLYTSYMCAWFVPKIYNYITVYQFVSGALLLKIHFNSLNNCLRKLDETGVTGKDPSRLLELGVRNNAWMENFENENSRKIYAQAFSVWETQASKNRTRKNWLSDGPGPSGTVLLDKIKTIRKIHSSLCEIKEDLNSIYSLQLLTCVAQAFIFITANLYMIFTTLSSSAPTSFLQMSYPIIWAVTPSVELIIIVVTCTKTSKTANHTAILVHKLLVKECPTDIRNQLKLFSIQLLHRKMSFTAAGFFNLDMTLLQAVVGAATTYLVILIQFHNTYEGPQDL